MEVHQAWQSNGIDGQRHEFPPGDGTGQWKPGQGVMCYVDEDMVDKELFNNELVYPATEEE